MLMEDWFFSSPHGLPGILQTDTNNLILWEKRGKTVWFAFPPPSPSWLCLKSSGNFCEKKLSYCVGSAGYQRSFPEDCYAPGWCAGHCEQEREVMMEKFCRGGGLGERQRMTQPPVKTRETCVPVSAPVCVELFIWPRKKNLNIFFLIFYFRRKILFEIYFAWFQGK